MTAATVASAGMTAFAVTVMVASDVGVIAEITCEQRLNRRVARADDTAEQTDACLRERHLRAAADTAANQDVRAVVAEHGRKRAVSLTVCIHNGRRNDLSVFNIVNLERFGVTEMLKDLFVFISNCNFHHKLRSAADRRLIVFYKIICFPHESPCRSGIYRFINSNCAIPVQ